ncbi:plastocyanin/azurin family copper-binding protein [Sphingomonas sp.]|uniref:plastocyanin/azurin family copper-binding protein n=1 Tax=Sphingomonas sp. TaxID=28214 RepID=UPI003B3B9FD7
MKYAITLVLAGLAVSTAAPAQNWKAAKRIDIDLRDFKYTPNRIVLRHGQPYILHFVNRARGGHDFTAKSFFSAAQISPGDRAKAYRGKVQLRGGESADIRLIAPAVANYDVHCSHFMHDTFGMTGVIAVQ